ncbi:MAG: outer membrane beta-barrel protein [Jannaschia sp.]
MKLLAAPIAILAVLGAPAFAGNVEPVVVEPPLAPAPVFTAPAYDWTGFYIGLQGNYADVSTSGGTVLDDDGGLYGLRAGYDYDLGSAIAGGFVQFDRGSIELAGSGVEVEDVLRIGGRLGFDGGRNFYYASAGYTDIGTNTIGSADGYFVGLGYEVFLTQAVTLGAEAIYHDVGDFDLLPGTDAEATTVGLNLNFRF